MAARKFFEKLAVWAGAWQAVNIGAYIAGLLVAGVLGEGGGRGYGHGQYFGAASAIVVLILVRLFWRRYHWSVVPFFLLFDAIFAAASLWANHVRYSQFAASGGANRGMMASHGPDIWAGFTEPLLAKALGYIVAMIAIALLSKKGTQEESDPAVQTSSVATGEASAPAGLIAVFCGIACADAVSGWFTALGYASLGTSMPLKQLQLSAQFSWGLAALVTAIFYMAVGRIFRTAHKSVMIGTAIFASCLAQSGTILRSFVPQLFLMPDGMRFPATAILHLLGLALLTALVAGVFFWVGARARRAA